MGDFIGEGVYVIRFVIEVVVVILEEGGKLLWECLLGMCGVFECVEFVEVGGERRIERCWVFVGIWSLGIG